MASVTPFSDEQSRALVNLENRYQVWMEAERTLAALPYDLRKKQVGDRAYLYEIVDRGGNGRSLGPWSEENAATFTAYRARKSAAKLRSDACRHIMRESARLYRALRLPPLANEAGAILREADLRRLLGEQLLVVGTNAMVAYHVEAAGFINGAPDETEDFDMAWTARRPETAPDTLWNMLKAVDPSFTVNIERTFQARNLKAYAVEILVAPSRADTFHSADRPKPVPLPEQEWLLNGVPVDHVVACRDGSPARIVAPDPRWYALQKVWMSRQAKRNPLKRAKDAKQGRALLDAVHVAMPQYPLNAAFRSELPEALTGLFAEWDAHRPPGGVAEW